MKTLGNHEAVTELISLMKVHGLGLQAEELAAMVAILDDTEAQYSTLLSMTHDAMRHCVKAPEQGDSTAEQDPAQVFQKELEQILGQYSDTKEKIIVWVKTTLENFKQVGVPAWESALSNLDVQNLLREVQEQYDDSIGKVMASLQRTDRKRAKVLSLLIGCIAPERLKNIASKAANIVWQAQGKDEKPSICGQLGKKKEEIASRSPSAPVKPPHEIKKKAAVPALPGPNLRRKTHEAER